jgi:hypothetical protein
MFIIKKSQIAPRNVEISMDLAGNLAFNHPKFCAFFSLVKQKKVCQLCYGWSLAQGNLVPRCLAATQSIGEPGTQLTMNIPHWWCFFRRRKRPNSSSI